MRGAVLLLLGGFGLSNAVPAAELAPSIGKVSLGQTRPQIEAALGKPLRVIKTGDALDPELRYDGITVWFWDGDVVAQIRSTGRKHCLVEGLCPGDPRRKVEVALGKPIAHEGSTLHYLVKAEACWLEVSVVGEVVGSLEIKCQP